MKLLLLVAIFISFIIMSSLYISKEDKSLDAEIQGMKHKYFSDLKVFHMKYERLDINAKDFDLQSTIAEVDRARKLYPLDDKLKMISIELNHKLANESH